MTTRFFIYSIYGNNGLTSYIGKGYRSTTISEQDLKKELIALYSDSKPGYMISEPDFLEVPFEDIEKTYNAMKKEREK